MQLIPPQMVPAEQQRARLPSRARIIRKSASLSLAPEPLALFTRSPSTASAGFPFYNGSPVSLSLRSWVLVLLAVALGFAALNLPVPEGPWRLAPALLFPLIPLLMLRIVAGPQAWNALFRRLSAHDVALALGIALLNILATFAIGAVVIAGFGANPNPANAELGHLSTGGRLVFFATSVPQLLGEELLTILPLLALLNWFHAHLGWTFRRALLWAWLLSALPFALLHLPTYQWNLLQCLLVIGSARLVLSLAYLRSRNLLVSAAAHVLNDWMLLGGALALGAMGGGSA